MSALVALGLSLVVLGQVPGAWASVGIIVTVAGGKTVGDGGPATNAVLNFPYYVAVDVAGNLFIADAQNNRVRRVAAGARIITTVAGTGDAGFGGDGGPATSAQLWNPTGVTVDASGNLFIADAGNNRIRRVAADTGIITTVAGTGDAGFGGDGGAASSAQLWIPIGVALDAAGNLLIADAQNNRIRQITASTRIITTVAGTGDGGFGGDGGAATSAQLWIPTGVALDAAGNLFIADAGNNRIRQVAAGIITTIAGTGDAGFGGDGGPASGARLLIPTGVALDTAGNLFIADAANSRVRRVASDTGTITTVAGAGGEGFFEDGGPATSAHLLTPTGVALDAAGNLFIADADDNRIRRVAARTGIITTVAGAGGAGFFEDGGPATAAKLSNPAGVALDAAGNLFIADAASNRIRRVAAGTGIITTVAGTGVAGFFGDGDSAPSAELWTPTGVALDAAGNLFIADAENNRIRRVAAGTGIITTVAGTGTPGFSGDDGPATSAQLWTPTGIAVDPLGNLLIADANNDRVRRVAANTGIITTVAGTGHAGFAGDEGPAAGAELNFPYYVALDRGGNLFIADQGNFRIRRVETDTGIITTVAGTGIAGFSGDEGPATSANLSVPYGVALDARGNLFIADQGNFRIRQVETDTGIITTVAGTGIAGFSGDGGPATSAQLSVSYGIALDAAGNLFIADAGNHRVRAIDRTASALRPVITSGPDNPTSETSATFTFVAVEPGVVRFACQLDDGRFTPCLTPQTYPGPLTFGAHTFRVIATNHFEDTSAPATYTWNATTPIFTLTVGKQGTGSGSVTSSPAGILCGATCAANYMSDTAVTLTAAPDTGSIFTGWSGDGCSGTDACTVTVAATTAVTATFSRIFPLTVNRTGTGSGTVESNPGAISCGATCSTTFASGSVVTLTASPDANSLFTGWSGECSGTGPCVVTVSAPTTVTATFASAFVLTVSTAGTGAGTVRSAPAAINCGLICSASFVSGAVVTLTVSPGANSLFTGWSGGGCSGTGSCVVTVSSATTVTATFASVFVLTVSTGGTGAGTVGSTPAGIDCGTTCAASFLGGRNVTLTASPDGGSAFIGWSGGGCSGIAPCTLTIEGTTVVTATFNVTGPFAFTEPNLLGGLSIIKAVHIAELRDAINTARTHRGLTAFSFTDPNLMVGSTTIQAVHIAELRTALSEAYATGPTPAQTYTDPTLGDGTTVVKAVHIRELRSAVQTLP